MRAAAGYTGHAMSNHPALPEPMPAGAVIDGEGVWCQVLAAPRRPGPALFLDRDGVIVEEVNYLHKPADMRLVDGAARIIARANRLGVPVVVVTNQAGIGAGRYGWPDFCAVQDTMIEALAGLGARVDAVYACPHHAKGKAPYNVADHPARKPNPGMLLRAGAALGLDLARSWIVGDRAGDVMAGRNAGLAGGVHVTCGHGSEPGERENALAAATAAFPVRPAGSIADLPGIVDILGD